MLHCIALRPGLLQTSWLVRRLDDTLVNLGQLYGFANKNNNELHVYQEALDAVLRNIAHTSMSQLQIQLSRIFAAMGKMYLN